MPGEAAFMNASVATVPSSASVRFAMSACSAAWPW